MKLAAQVAVNNATFHFDKLYTYYVPEKFEDIIQIGSMVLVPFGRGNKSRMGVVLGVSQQEENKKIKEIFDVSKEDVILTDELLNLVYFLKDRTFCTYYEAVKAIIPYGAQYKPVFMNGIHSLQKQIVRHTQKLYSIKQPLDMTIKYTAKQRKVINFLLEKSEIESNITSACDVGKSVLDTMCKNNILEISLVDKVPEIIFTPEKITITNLSEPQQKVFNEIREYLDINEPHLSLLHGVTSSGKTNIFIKLIEETIKKGKTALILVPEISLTPQMIERLQNAFGTSVAVQHSALSNTQRLLQWSQIQRGDVNIVVGTRSAIFSPLKNIGLIILDEEHEHTYSSESSPRYSAHDIAKQRAVNNDALLVLASATPSIDSYYNAKLGRYSLHTLSTRYNDMPLPEVRLVDIRNELASGNVGSISKELANEIHQNLKNNEQTILLLNRRGYNTVGMCKNCGEVIKCDSCSVPMVYHKKDDTMRCHYCGKMESGIRDKCKICGGDIRFTGFGTQKIEEELTNIFPDIRILRMDMDTTSVKNSHRDMLKSFGKGEYDLLIGTQMVAKGLDFENVTLVGVIGIDNMLFSQNYKASENVFSMVTQVVGRGGRGDKKGRALIQTVDTQNAVLQLAAHQDYISFYNDTIGFRKLNLYPPFCNICVVCFSAEKEIDASQGANVFANLLIQTAKTNKDVPLRLLGPAPFQVEMVKNRYRYKITLKCRNNKAFRSLLLQVSNEFINMPQASKVSMYFDFNSNQDL